MHSFLRAAWAVLVGIALIPPGSVAQARPAPRTDEREYLLKIEPVHQLELNSCGEAALLMAYNHAYPVDPLTEKEIIRYAKAVGYYTPNRWPFTSPANMVRIAGNFVAQVSTGNAATAEEGLSLLDGMLQQDRPVVIDILTRLYDPRAGAHFVVVTGLSVDEARGNAIMVHFNDPLSGDGRRARWAGNEGIWNAWKNNGDPGGSGWWMVIH